MSGWQTGLAGDLRGSGEPAPSVSLGRTPSGNAALGQGHQAVGRAGFAVHALAAGCRRQKSALPRLGPDKSPLAGRRQTLPGLARSSRGREQLREALYESQSMAPDLLRSRAQISRYLAGELPLPPGVAAPAQWRQRSTPALAASLASPAAPTFMPRREQLAADFRS